MFKSYLIQICSKFDAEFQQKIITPELAIPRSIATFLLGYNLYIRYIDHQVRKQIALQKKNEDFLIKLLAQSQKQSYFLQKFVAASGIFTCWYAFHQTKKHIWLFGATLFASIQLLSELFVYPVSSRLIILSSGLKPPEKQQLKSTKGKFDLLKSWLNRYTIKIVLCALTVFSLYYAELKHSEQLDVKLSMKK